MRANYLATGQEIPSLFYKDENGELQEFMGDTYGVYIKGLQITDTKDATTTVTGLEEAFFLYH